MTGFSVPVVVSVFNRPENLPEVLRSVAAVSPSRLFVIADGPRPEVHGDIERCARVRELVEASVTWPTSLIWNSSNRNLGCRKRLQSGLDWVFDQTERAIIIEDDCVADPSFFLLCADLLERYADEPRVATIGGSNVLAAGAPASSGYVFSRYPAVWGWATWARTWKVCDHDIDAWPALRETDWLDNLLETPLARAYWRRVFDQVRMGFDTWDYSLTFSCWLAGGLSIHPATNLVTNVGFGPGATHTREPTPLANLARATARFPLQHPSRIARDAARDLALERTLFSGTIGQTLSKARDRIAMSRPR